MLDVSIVGAVVAVCATSDLRGDGVVASLSSGILPLIGAELCRRMMVRLTHCMAQDGGGNSALANPKTTLSEPHELEEGTRQCAVSAATSAASSNVPVAAHT